MALAKQIAEYLYNGIVLSDEKEHNIDSCSQIDESPKPYMLGKVCQMQENAHPVVSSI